LVSIRVSSVYRFSRRHFTTTFHRNAQKDTASFVQEIRSESPDYPTPLAGKGGWLPQAMKNHPSPVIASEAHVPSAAWGKQSPGRYGDCFVACGGSQCNGRKFSIATTMAVGVVTFVLEIPEGKMHYRWKASTVLGHPRQCICWQKVGFFYELLSPLQKLTTEHIEYTERVSFMNFCHKAHVTQPYFQ